jgi:hypothetical protein
MYKDAYEKTGKIYWFFTVADNNEIQIMRHEDFAKFKKDNKKLFSSGKIEFARISEFRIA